MKCAVIRRSVIIAPLASTRSATPPARTDGRFLDGRIGRFVVGWPSVGHILARGRFLDRREMRRRPRAPYQRIYERMDGDGHGVCDPC